MIDFIFKGECDTPFRARQNAFVIKLYILEDSLWKDLRPLTKIEAGHYLERKLPDHEAKLYEFGVPFLKDEKPELGLCAFGGPC